MPQPQNGGDDRNDSQRTVTNETAGQSGANRRHERTERGRERESTSDWLAKTGLLSGLAVVGFALLLFALGQVVGFDLLGLVVDALSSQTGRWLVVALFALLLIGVAERGLRGTFRHG
ncbi:hypothetical protein [Haladaptatus salinisoli]|uniref:hypothetical protein n=1 Tax=Haladaptatus salinisoli TaxID=2884876 RepID=UPI001D09FFA0|nr:hypothetical protein [Haladaptatus salinisoli]